jgi:hypothetical protein
VAGTPRRLLQEEAPAMRVPPIRRIALAGILATMTMDLTSQTTWRLIGAARASRKLRPQLLGRWVGHMRRGRFRHSHIERAPELAHELPTGLATHYLIGVALTAGYLGLLRAFKTKPSGSTAVAYGAATSALPWLVLHPAFGYGWFGLREEPTGTLITTSVLAHLGFGAGIGVWTKALVPPR